MLNRFQTTTSVVTFSLVLLTWIYHQTPINNKKLLYSSNCRELSELNELRHDLNELKRKISHIEQILSSSNIFNSLTSWIQTIFSYLTYFSTSFFLYTFFLYLFHLCIFNSSTTKTIKILHIVNIISYSFISIFYTTLNNFHYSNLAWLIFVLLFIRCYIH